MPVTTWMARRVSEALPNTYHQPIGPAAPRGIGWVSEGRMLDRKARRASSHRPNELSRRIIGLAPSRRPVLGVLQARVVRRLHFQLVAPHAPFAGEEPARRR